jgi:hypothetical protein
VALGRKPSPGESPYEDGSPERGDGG